MAASIHGIEIVFVSVFVVVYRRYAGYVSRGRGYAMQYCFSFLARLLLR